MSKRDYNETLLKISDRHQLLEEQIKSFDDNGAFVENEIIRDLLAEMSAAEKREVKSYLRNIVLHLLKWDYQPEKRTRSWMLSITNSRNQLVDIFDDSRSLINYAKSVYPEIYSVPKRNAEIETGVDMPGTNPYSLEDVLEKRKISLDQIKKR